MAEHFHTLPYEGGLFDQPAGVMFKMEAVLRADTTDKREEEKSKAKERVERKITAMKAEASGVRRT